jgi:hypothetical protein
VNAFAMTGTGIVIVLVAVYILMNAACIGYFALQEPQGEKLESVPAPGRPCAGHRHVRARLADIGGD